MSRSVKWLMGVLIAVTAVSVIAAVFMAAHREGRGEGVEEEESVPAPSHVSLQEGRTVVTLDPQTRAREGIRVASLAATSNRAEVRGTAIILPVNDLAAARNNYVAARTKLERAQIDVQVSRSEYERVETLYQENQNMSLKAAQAAAGAYRTNQARAQADQQDAQLQLDTIRQRWGAVVAGWVAHDTKVLADVLDQSEFLAQVIFPPGEVAKAPPRLAVEAPGGHLVHARLVSALPQVDPQIQGISFLYLVPVQPGLAVGMNLVVYLPIGRRVTGVTVPQAAIVWWQGRAWAYEETAPDTFTRREVPAATPVRAGYFVAGKFAPGSRFVVAGAPVLLSEEYRSRTQGGD